MYTILNAACFNTILSKVFADPLQSVALYQAVVMHAYILDLRTSLLECDSEYVIESRNIGMGLR